MIWMIAASVVTTDGALVLLALPVAPAALTVYAATSAWLRVGQTPRGALT